MTHADAATLALYWFVMTTALVAALHITVGAVAWVATEKDGR